MKAWPEFYKDRIGSEEYEKYFINKYATFIELVIAALSLKPIEDPMKVKATMGEFGCGIGTTSKIILDHAPSELDLNIYGLDSDLDMLELCTQNFINSEKKINLINHDITTPLVMSKLDVIYSHGVLEHFSDPQIKEIIKHQKRLSGYLVHYVPSDKYESPSRGDERLLSADDWLKIAQPDTIVQFNKGLDLALVWTSYE